MSPDMQAAMPELWVQDFLYKGERCDVKVSLDEEGHGFFVDVGRGFGERIVLQGRCFWEEEIIEIQPDEGQPFQVRLDQPVPEEDDLADMFHIQFERDGRGVETLEKLLDRFPVGDPLGCLLKGALVSTIMQMIRCWKKSKDAEAPGSGISRTINCLRENGSSMAKSALWKTLRCLILLDLF